MLGCSLHTTPRDRSSGRSAPSTGTMTRHRDAAGPRGPAVEALATCCASVSQCPSPSVHVPVQRNAGPQTPTLVTFLDGVVDEDAHPHRRRRHRRRDCQKPAVFACWDGPLRFIRRGLEEFLTVLTLLGSAMRTFNVNDTPALRANPEQLTGPSTDQMYASPPAPLRDSPLPRQRVEPA